MRKILLTALVVLFTFASQAGAENCYIDPETGIETCHCTTLTVTDEQSGFCQFGHYENSCTGQVSGYWASCDDRAQEGCYIDPETGAYTCPPGCEPYETFIGCVCFDQNGFTNCSRLMATHYCDGSTYIHWTPCFDPNADGYVDSADYAYLYSYLYFGGPVPIGPADANGDAVVDFADLVYLYNFLNLGGPGPVCI